MKWRSILAAALAVGMIVVGIGAESAVGTTVSRPPDLSATVTASVKPTRLPADEAAPVTLRVEGQMARRPTCLGECPELRSIEVRLDPQITAATKDLPVCQVNDVKGSSLSQARQKCGGALIGKGATTETVQFVEAPAFTRTSKQLFFNAGKGRVLMYSYAPQLGAGGAGLVGTIRRLVLRTGGDASEVSFQFSIGKTWHAAGERRSYLSGRCRTGTLKQRVTLAMSDGSTASEASPESCRGSGARMG